MASHLIFLSLLLTTTAISTTATSTSPPPSPPPSPLPSPSPSPSPPPTPPPSPPPPPLSPLPPPPTPSPLPTPNHQLQFNALLDALIGAGDFTNWANLLAEVADPTIIPISATFFVPDDDAFLTGLTRPPPETTLNFLDPLLFPYHILPRRLSFAALCLFPDGTRLPTLLPGFSLLINNHSAANFTISGARVTRPDLYQNNLISVHGVGSVLDYTLFGRDAPPPTPPLSELNDGEFAGGGDRKKIPATQIMKSEASNSCTIGFRIVSFVGLVVLCFGH